MDTFHNLISDRQVTRQTVLEARWCHLCPFTAVHKKCDPVACLIKDCRSVLLNIIELYTQCYLKKGSASITMLLKVCNVINLNFITWLKGYLTICNQDPIIVENIL